MNKTIKTILLVIGFGLLGYGIYTLIVPEASISMGFAHIQFQDNNNSYASILLGLIALIIGFVGNKKILT